MMSEKSVAVVALEILRQLGGQQFMVMTGAKDMLAEPNGLTFRIPARMAKNGINIVSVLLNADDEYDVTFSKVSMKKQTNIVVSMRHGIYCDQLRGLFERETGLYTSL